MAWLPAVIGAVGSIVGGRMVSRGQERANQMNMAIAQKQMDFEERMSNTSWQRGMKDMQAAGMNPMLAFSQGGASSPHGSAIPVQNEEAGLGAGVAGAAASAASMAVTKKQLENIEADTSLKVSSAAQAEANVALMRTTKERVANEIDKIQQEISNLRTEQDARRFDVDKLLPLKAVYQEWLNKQKAAQVPEAEADGKFWSMIQEEGGITAKALMFLKQLVK